MADGFAFIKAITIDLIEIEFFKNAEGKYKTISTFIDCDDIPHEQIYDSFDDLYDVFSDYIDKKELNFDPCVIIFRHLKEPS